MRQFLRDPRYSLIELILVILSGAIWTVSRQLGGWFILITLSLFLLKVFTGNLKFIKPDWIILVFLTTAWAGYWAAYDQTVAWNKVWFIVIGVMLYYSLREQPEENLIAVSVFFFFIGVGISLYYFLTYDFIAAPRRLEFVNSIGRWFMSIRPQTSWMPILPNYAAGVTAITVPFILYPIWEIRNDNKTIPIWFYIFSITGLSIACLAIVMATSRGIVLAIGSGIGAWILWRLTQLRGIRHRFKNEALFPSILLIYLCAVIGFLYLGPAQLGGAISDANYYGTGSRAELFARSLFLVSDYPLIGGGLGSFPGLYSQYMLGIPFFYLPNSHNLFLDVTIEQGLLGGFSFLFIYVIGVWMVASSIANKDGSKTFKWLVLYALIIAIIQGMVSNYLYNGAGSMLSLFLVGLALNGKAPKPVESNLNGAFVVTVISIIVVVGILNINLARSVWYANLGSVQMMKVELKGFPDNGWVGDEIVPELDQADSTLHSSLQLDPSNRTANQRLGMIAMYRMDFEAAENYLEIAHRQAPSHRGVIKYLGYSYLWSGDFQKAQSLLAQIPEVEQELNVYTWWWDAQGRSDLADTASFALKNINMTVSNP